MKVARRKPRKDGRPTKTQSRITLGPFDSYFRRPKDPVPGVGIAYGDMALHLDLIVPWRAVPVKREPTPEHDGELRVSAGHERRS